jgi:hypothetical protein
LISCLYNDVPLSHRDRMITGRVVMAICEVHCVELLCFVLVVNRVIRILSSERAGWSARSTRIYRIGTHQDRRCCDGTKDADTESRVEASSVDSHLGKGVSYGSGC